MQYFHSFLFSKTPLLFPYPVSLSLSLSIFFALGRSFAGNLRIPHPPNSLTFFFSSFILASLHHTWGVLFYCKFFVSIPIKFAVYRVVHVKRPLKIAYRTRVTQRQPSLTNFASEALGIVSSGSGEASILSFEGVHNIQYGCHPARYG